MLQNPLLQLGDDDSGPELVAQALDDAVELVKILADLLG